MKRAYEETGFIPHDERDKDDETTLEDKEPAAGDARLTIEEIRTIMYGTRSECNGRGACRAHSKELLSRLRGKRIDARIAKTLRKDGLPHFFVETDDLVLDAYPEGAGFTAEELASLSAGEGFVAIKRDSDLAGKFYKEERINADDHAPSIALGKWTKRWRLRGIYKEHHEVINKAWAELWRGGYELSENARIVKDMIKELKKHKVKKLPIHVYSPPEEILRETIRKYDNDKVIADNSKFRLLTHPGTFRDENGKVRSYNILVPKEVVEFLMDSPKAYREWLDHEVHHILERINGKVTIEKEFAKKYPVKTLVHHYNLRLMKTIGPDTVIEEYKKPRFNWPQATKEAKLVLFTELAEHIGVPPGALAVGDFSEEVPAFGDKSLIGMLKWAEIEFASKDYTGALKELKRYFEIRERKRQDINEHNILERFRKGWIKWAKTTKAAKLVMVEKLAELLGKTPGMLYTLDFQKRLPGFNGKNLQALFDWAIDKFGAENYIDTLKELKKYLGIKEPVVKHKELLRLFLKGMLPRHVWGWSTKRAKVAMVAGLADFVGREPADLLTNHFIQVKVPELGNKSLSGLLNWAKLAYKCKDNGTALDELKKLLAIDRKIEKEELIEMFKRGEVSPDTWWAVTKEAKLYALGLLAQKAGTSPGKVGVNDFSSKIPELGNETLSSLLTWSNIRFNTDRRGKALDKLKKQLGIFEQRERKNSQSRDTWSGATKEEKLAALEKIAAEVGKDVRDLKVKDFFRRPGWKRLLEWAEKEFNFEGGVPALKRLKRYLGINEDIEAEELIELLKKDNVPPGTWDRATKRAKLAAIAFLERSSGKKAWKITTNDILNTKIPELNNKGIGGLLSWALVKFNTENKLEALKLLKEYLGIASSGRFYPPIELEYEDRETTKGILAGYTGYQYLPEMLEYMLREDIKDDDIDKLAVDARRGNKASYLVLFRYADRVFRECAGKVSVIFDIPLEDVMEMSLNFNQLRIFDSAVVMYSGREPFRQELFDDMYRDLAVFCANENMIRSLVTADVRHWLSREISSEKIALVEESADKGKPAPEEDENRSVLTAAKKVELLWLLNNYITKGSTRERNIDIFRKRVFEGKTQAEIAREVGLSSRERVRQIEVDIWRKICRNPALRKQFEAAGFDVEALAGRTPGHGKRLTTDDGRRTTGEDDAPSIAVIKEKNKWVQYEMTPDQHKAINRAWASIWAMGFELPENDSLVLDVKDRLFSEGIEGKIHIHSPPASILYQEIYKQAKMLGAEFPPQDEFRLIAHPGTYRDKKTGKPRSYNLLIPRESLEFLENSPAAYGEWITHEIGHLMERKAGKITSEKKFTKKHFIGTLLRKYNLLTDNMIGPQQVLQVFHNENIKNIPWQRITIEAKLLLMKEFARVCGKPAGALNVGDLALKLSRFNGRPFTGLVKWAREEFRSQSDAGAVKKLKDYLGIKEESGEYIDVKDVLAEFKKGLMPWASTTKEAKLFMVRKLAEALGKRPEVLTTADFNVPVKEFGDKMLKGLIGWARVKFDCASKTEALEKLKEFLGIKETIGEKEIFALFEKEEIDWGKTTKEAKLFMVRKVASLLKKGPEELSTNDFNRDFPELGGKRLWRLLTWAEREFGAKDHAESLIVLKKYLGIAVKTLEELGEKEILRRLKTKHLFWGETSREVKLIMFKRLAKTLRKVPGALIPSDFAKEIPGTGTSLHGLLVWAKGEFGCKDVVEALVKLKDYLQIEVKPDISERKILELFKRGKLPKYFWERTEDEAKLLMMKVLAEASGKAPGALVTSDFRKKIPELGDKSLAGLLSWAQNHFDCNEAEALKKLKIRLSIEDTSDAEIDKDEIYSLFQKRPVPWGRVTKEAKLFMVNKLARALKKDSRLLDTADFKKFLPQLGNKSLFGLVDWAKTEFDCSSDSEAVKKLKEYLEISEGPREYIGKDEILKAMRSGQVSWDKVTKEGKLYMVRKLAKSRKKKEGELNTMDFQVQLTEFGSKSLTGLLDWARNRFKCLDNTETLFALKDYLGIEAIEIDFEKISEKEIFRLFKKGKLPKGSWGRITRVTKLYFMRELARVSRKDTRSLTTTDFQPKIKQFGNKSLKGLLDWAFREFNCESNTEALKRLKAHLGIPEGPAPADEKNVLKAFGKRLVWSDTTREAKRFMLEKLAAARTKTPGKLNVNDFSLGIPEFKGKNMLGLLRWTRNEFNCMSDREALEELKRYLGIKDTLREEIGKEEFLELFKEGRLHAGSWARSAKETKLFMFTELARYLGKDAGELIAVDFRTRLPELGHRSINGLLSWARREFNCPSEPDALLELKKYFGIKETVPARERPFELTYEDWDATRRILRDYDGSEGLPGNIQKFSYRRFEKSTIDELERDARKGNKASYHILALLAERLCLFVAGKWSGKLGVTVNYLLDMPYSSLDILNTCIKRHEEEKGAFFSYLYATLYWAVFSCYSKERRMRSIDVEDGVEELDRMVYKGQALSALEGQREAEELWKPILPEAMKDISETEFSIFAERCQGATVEETAGLYGLSPAEVQKIEKKIWDIISREPDLAEAFGGAELDYFAEEEGAGKEVFGIKDAEKAAAEFANTALLHTFEKEKEEQKIIIGLDTSWIPGMRGRQGKAIQELLSEIYRLAEHRGLKNIIVVRGKGNTLAEEILKKAETTKTPLRNVIVLAGKDTIKADGFNGLKSTETEERAFIAGVDPANLAENSYMHVLEMLDIAMRLAFKETESTDFPGIQLDKVGPKIWIFIPQARPMSFRDLEKTYKAQLDALIAA